jgi:hypothetical protein
LKYIRTKRDRKKERKFFFCSGRRNRNRYNQFEILTEAYYFKGLSFEKLNLKDSAKINFIRTLALYNKGYKNKDIYNEMFQEIYRENI